MFHFLSEAELENRRCLMTLFFLPSDLEQMDDNQPPFTAALKRMTMLPQVYRVDSSSKPPADLWNEMVNQPVIVLMTNDEIPDWLPTLTDVKPVGVVAQSPETAKALSGFPGVRVGLLRGFDDLRETYRVIGELGKLACETFHRSAIGELCGRLSQTDLFTKRPRLRFMPPFPLPQPNNGRSAAYLLNRLSNNFDEPALARDSPSNSIAFLPQFLGWSVKACALLTAVEMGREAPANLKISRAELENYHSTLTSDSISGDDKFKLLLEIGQRISGFAWPTPPLIALPVPRLDLAKGKVPESVQLDPGHKQRIRSGLEAASDFIAGRERTAFGTKRDREDYRNARETLLNEQRIIACQAAWLASAGGAIPFQLGVLPGQLYNVLHDFGCALAANSKKIPELFRTLEARLSAVLPDGLLEQLNQGTSPVIFLSDLPFEWALVENWPICLSRPVCRIPTSLNSWDVLSASSHRSIHIDVRKPERVLVFDLIEEDDPIRQDSDAFAQAANSLKQHYQYATPKSPREFRTALERYTPDIVVVDAHGAYDRLKDEVLINLRGTSAPIADLLPEGLAPPVWIFSACSTSTTGAMRGCCVRQLLAHGAVSVIATLGRVDAFIASMFVGRLLTNVFNPLHPGMFRTLQDVFFMTQFTTALLYDPMLPLIRRSGSDPAIRQAIGPIFREFFAWADRGHDDLNKYRNEAAWLLGSLLAQSGLTDKHQNLVRAGLVRPETLLFTSFGLPGCILVGDSED